MDLLFDMYEAHGPTRRRLEERKWCICTDPNSITIEIIAVTTAIEWLETETFRYVYFLSDSMSMLRKIETGCIRRE
jgi:ribonuclease HI